MANRRLEPLLLLLLLLLPLANPGALSIYLKTAVYLEAETYTLSDVASVPAGQGGAAGAVLRLSLGPVPRRLTLLSAQSIGAALAEAGYTEVALVGGAVALLPRASVPKGSEGFFEQLLAFLGGVDGVGGGRMEVEVLESDPVQPSTGYSFSPAGPGTGGSPRVGSVAGLGSRTGSPLAGELLLWFRQSASSAPEPGGGRIRVWVHRYLPVAYTATSVPARSRLDGGQIVYREEDVSLGAATFLTRLDGVEKRLSAMGLPFGTRLEPRHLERILAVRAGDPIAVVFLRPGLRVSVPGRAAGSGAVGERIEVRLNAGGRRFDGLIAGTGEVCVEGF